MDKSVALLRLLQLCNSSLPVGAYSYSEGLETLCYRGKIVSETDLQDWLHAELEYGSIRVEAAIMARAYRALRDHNSAQLQFWNYWYAANRETEELRSQSNQMGRSLLKLFLDLEPTCNAIAIDPRQCHWPIAFGVVAAYWQIDLEQALLGYLQGWAANLVNAGVKLIPLGQTQGQQIIAKLGDAIALTSSLAIDWEDDSLESNSWGLQLASMEHETLYSRIFRS